MRPTIVETPPSSWQQAMVRQMGWLLLLLHAATGALSAGPPLTATRCAPPSLPTLFRAPGLRQPTVGGGGKRAAGCMCCMHAGCRGVTSLHLVSVIPVPQRDPSWEHDSPASSCDSSREARGGPSKGGHPGELSGVVSGDSFHFPATRCLHMDT